MREKDLDIAKGLGILLVVLGHIASVNSPVSTEWYLDLKYFVYRFHMPFFMCLSGLVFFLISIDKIKTLNDYFSFVKKRSYRLLLPFFIFGAVIIIGKFTVSQFMQVENIPDDFFTGVINIFWNVDKSPAGSIWYIFVLFIFCVFVPVLLKIPKNNLFIMFGLSFLLYFIDLPPYLYLKLSGEFLVFFIIGGVIALYYKEYTEKLDKYWIIWLMIFGISFITLYTEINEENTKFIIGCASISALHALCRKSFMLKSNFFSILGEYSFVIYLLNTICIGVVKLGITRFVSNDINFIFIFIPAVLSGIIIPILVKKYIFKFKYIKFLDDITN